LLIVTNGARVIAADSLDSRGSVFLEKQLAASRREAERGARAGGPLATGDDKS